MLDSSPLIIASPLVTEEVCFSVPAVRALHYAWPDSPITILCAEEHHALWQTVEGLAEIISHPASASHRKIAKLISAAGDYSQAGVWEDGPAAVAFAKKGITKRLGPPLEKLSKWLTTPPRPALPTQLRIGIAPGSDFGPSAEWSMEKFRALATSLQAELLIFASPGRPAAAKALRDLGRWIPESDTLREVSSCHLLIGNDGALPHLAAHMGTPCVVLFGPNEPAWKRPLGKIHRVVRRHVACSPCFLDKCPLDHRCLAEISEAEVLEEVRKILEFTE